MNKKGFISFLLVIAILPTVMKVGQMRNKVGRKSRRIKSFLIEQQKITNIENDIETTFWQSLEDQRKEGVKKWQKEMTGIHEKIEINIYAGKINGGKKFPPSDFVKEVPTKKRMEIKKGGKIGKKEGIIIEISSEETKSIYVIPEGNSIEY